MKGLQIMKGLKMIKKFNSNGNNVNVMKFALRSMSIESNHFRVTNTKHPLIKKEFTDSDYGDHTGRLQNYIWNKEEVNEKMENYIVTFLKLYQIRL